MQNNPANPRIQVNPRDILLSGLALLCFALSLVLIASQ